MSIPKGRQCRIEVAATYAATALAVTGVAKGNPGVITSAGHGLAAGTVGYFDTITGMDEMLGQAVSASAVSADNFEAERLDTTNFGDFVSGTFTHVESWLTLSNSTSYEIGGGAADKLDRTTLLDRIKQEENGLLAAQTVSISGFSDPLLAAMDIVRAAALNDGYAVFRITFKNGERRIWRGQPSLPGESLSVSQLATGSFDVSVKGQVLSLPVAA
nr:phage tail tube protein [uncultured Albidiferax sp.]